LFSPNYFLRLFIAYNNPKPAVPTPMKIEVTRVNAANLYKKLKAKAANTCKKTCFSFVNRDFKIFN